MEMQRVRELLLLILVLADANVDVDADVVVLPSTASSCGHLGNRRGKYEGAKLFTSHERIFCQTAKSTLGFWPRINLGLGLIAV